MIDFWGQTDMIPSAFSSALIDENTQTDIIFIPPPPPKVAPPTRIDFWGQTDMIPSAFSSALIDENTQTDIIFIPPPPPRAIPPPPPPPRAIAPPTMIDFGGQTDMIPSAISATLRNMETQTQKPIHQHLLS